MIIRLSTKLAKKIKEPPLQSLPADPNPFADWSARLFTADRAQYILVTNTVSLYSGVIFGRGITDNDALIKGTISLLRDLMRDDGFEFLYRKFVVPATGEIYFAKALSRSVTGSMNDFVFQAKDMLWSGEVSPYDVSFRLNDTPMGALKYQTPRKASQAMKPQL